MATRRAFRFGVINETIGSAEEWRERVRQTEALGYATFLIRDHLVPDFFGPQLAPLSALMAAAGLTTSLRIGTLVLATDYRHPALLAKEAATLDFLSGGRLELGLGAGWLRREYDSAGIRYDTPGVRIARLAEAIQVLKGLFASAPFSFAGQHFTLNDLEGLPRPVQRPHPPLLIGGGSQRILTLAGTEADIVSLLTTSVATGVVTDDPWERLPAKVAAKLAWVRQGAGDRFPAIELSLVPTILLTDHRHRATEQFIHERGWSGINVEHVWLMPSIFIGSVDQIATDMQQRREEFGISYYVLSDAVLAEMAPLVARLAGR